MTGMHTIILIGINIILNAIIAVVGGFSSYAYQVVNTCRGLESDYHKFLVDRAVGKVKVKVSKGDDQQNVGVSPRALGDPDSFFGGNQRDGLGFYNERELLACV